MVHQRPIMSTRVKFLRLVVSVLLFSSVLPLKASNFQLPNPTVCQAFCKSSTSFPFDPRRREFMPVPEGDPQHVLSYLRDMIELCRNAHRPDIEHEYQDAWRLAAAQIYGPLPPRAACKGHYVSAPVVAGPPPKWKRDMLSKPYRKIVRRFTELDGSLRSEYEQLECGHRIMALMELPGASPAKRRRCGECAHEAQNKKPVASEGSPRKKGATA